MLLQGSATKPVWPVAVYARLSRNKPQRCWECDGRGESPDQPVCGTCNGRGQTPGLSTNTAIQVAECRAELEELADDRRVELDIVAIFEEDDTGASKFSTKPRPLFDSLVELARENRIETIISTEPERLYRKPKDADQVIMVSETTRLRELYFTAEGGSIDLATPNGIYEARNTPGLGERESNKTSRRQRRKQADKARLGKATGGHRAFGFLEGDPRLGRHYRPHNTELNPSEVEALLGMAARYIDGWSDKEIAWWLNREGITTREGKPFRAITVRNMLQRKRYHPHPDSPDPANSRGIRDHHGAEYVAVWSAIFDSATSEKLLLEIRRRRELKGTGRPARRYLLTGLARCGKCGAWLNGEATTDHPGAPKRRIYYCRTDKSRDLEREHGCGGVRRNADALDMYITEQALRALESPGMATLLAEDQPDDTRLGELLDQRKAILRRLDSLDDDYMDGRITDKARLSRMRDRGEANLEAVETEISAINRRRLAVGRIPVGDSLRQKWADSESDAWKREILGMLIESITVNPTQRKPFYGDTGMRFDPAAIDIKWRV